MAIYASFGESSEKVPNNTNTVSNVGTADHIQGVDIEVESSDLYPIHLKKDDDRYIKLVANLRAKFCQEGIVTLPGFLRLDVIPDIAKVELYSMNCGLFSF